MSKIVHLGMERERNPQAQICPPGLEHLRVKDWYIGDSQLVPTGPDHIILGGYSREHGPTIIGETILTVASSHVFHATRAALQEGIVLATDHQVLAPPVDGRAQLS